MGGLLGDEGGEEVVLVMMGASRVWGIGRAFLREVACRRGVWIDRLVDRA